MKHTQSHKSHIRLLLRHLNTTHDPVNYFAFIIVCSWQKEYEKDLYKIQVHVMRQERWKQMFFLIIVFFFTSLYWTLESRIFFTKNIYLVFRGMFRFQMIVFFVVFCHFDLYPFKQYNFLRLNPFKNMDWFAVGKT